MSTGAIIAIAVIAAIILIALLVVIPRMRRSAAERRIKWEREKRAEEHRDRAKLQHTKAELAEQEARKQRAEAEIHAKRAELHEHGLADHELESTPASAHDGGTTDTRGRSEHDDHVRDDAQGGGRYREATGGGPAHEPEGERRFARRDERETATEPETRTAR